MTFSDNERRLFVDFERAVSTDLSEWKSATLSLREGVFFAVYQSYREVIGRMPDLGNATDIRELSRGMRSELYSRWKHDSDAPQYGDMIELDGTGIVQLFNDDGEYQPIPLVNETRLLGRLVDMDIQGYLDPGFLELYAAIPEDGALEESVARGFYRPFGLHLVVDDLSEIDEDGNVRRVETMPSVYVPLDNPGFRMYKQVKM